VALAAIGLLSGAASAQTAVTVYGLADVGVNRTDNGLDSVLQLKSNGQSGSRVGFRGTEDLGGGLSALFVLENGFNVDTGSFSVNNKLFGRLAYVGLNGGFGSVKLGRTLSPLKAAHEQIDPFGAAGDVGSLERIFYAHQTGTAGSSSASYLGNDNIGRTDNTINYATPNFAGFTAQAAYSFGEATGTTATGRRVGFGLGYVSGPLNVQFGYDKTNAGILTVSAITAPAVTLAAPSTFDSANAFLGAVYNFGVAKLHLAYAHTKIEPLAGAERSYRDGLLGVSIPVGAGTIIGSYIVHQNRDLDENDAKLIAIGYTYDLSKRTNFYTGYSVISNDDNVRVGGGVSTTNGFSGAEQLAANGESVKVFNLGIRHRF
jgi:predicted porin